MSQKTVAKWQKRTSVADLPTEPRQPCSTILSVEDEAAIIAFRRHTLLPLDDCLYALQPSTPHLTRSSLHRCLPRHGISRLPEIEGNKPVKKKFKSYPIGYFHVDIAEVQTAQGKLYLLVAIDRTSKFAFIELHAKAGKMIAAQFLQHLVSAVPYTIHTVLTDNALNARGLLPNDNSIVHRSGIQFMNRACDRWASDHIFGRVCTEHSIEHRLTKIKHPWANGQVERMNRTIKEATVKRFHYDDHEQLQQHLADFIAAYNFGRRLKTLKGLTPYEFICKQWTSEPKRFKLAPLHQMPGLNT
ncbi:IS481 family transposase [Comamonas testosteroni]|uniref:IS481 family transposase n=1 Tax=Comamonas testosteroni TaxID=285 RepID=UPI00391D69C4